MGQDRGAGASGVPSCWARVATTHDFHRWLDIRRWFEHWLPRSSTPCSQASGSAGERQVRGQALHADRAATEHHLHDGAGLRERRICDSGNVCDPQGCYGRGRDGRVHAGVARLHVPAHEQMPARAHVHRWHGWHRWHGRNGSQGSDGDGCHGGHVLQCQNGQLLSGQRSDGRRRRRQRRAGKRVQARRGRHGHHRVRLPVRERQSAHGHPVQ